MQEVSRSAVEAVNPLIKLVKQRQDLYFQLLFFVNKNIEASSNDLDNITIFNKFLIEINLKHANIKHKEKEFLMSFEDIFAESDRFTDDPISKQMLRLSSRLIEILEASITKVRKSVFDENGKATKEFSRFKIMLNKILKRDAFIIKDYVQYIVNYCCNKYQKQVLKLQKYIQKIQQGQDIWFRQMYIKHTSDIEHSPDDKKIKDQQKTLRKIEKKIDMSEHLSSTEEPEKKAISLKKTMKTPMKRRERVLNIKNKQKQDQIEQPPNKQQTANKLLKFYALLQINKKQFIQDYVYDQIQEERHKVQLLSKLMERNKQINRQINSFVRKSCNYIPNASIKSTNNKSSGDQKVSCDKNQRNESVASKLSLRTSFVISKRKSSFHFQTSGNQKNSDAQKKQPIQPMQKTIKNINPRRRSSHSNNRPQEKSKKLFVIKSPMVFQEEIIPQAHITQTQWLQAPLTTKCRERKNDNIRLKRKNNPNPLQNAFLPQNFRYPF